MTSLQQLSGIGKKAVIALMFISTLALATAAQTVMPQNQGRLYGDPAFRGEPIKLNVVNADIRDILNYITEQYGINFVIDKSVKQVPVTVNVSDVPWNIALDSVLRSQELGIQVNGTILRVAENKSLAQEQDILLKVRDSQLDTSPLVTEFIRLNYARASGSLSDTAGDQNRLTAGTSVDQRGLGGVIYGSPLNILSGSSQAQSGQRITSSGGDKGILGIIQKRLSRRGAIEVDSRTNTLIVTDVRENIDAVRQLVTLLDQPEPQVEIETRIVVATRNFSRDIGIQLAALVVGPRGSGAGGGTLPGAPVDPGLRIPPSLPIGSIGGNLGAVANTAIGLTTGIFGTAQISALITAGENNGQAKVIATPRVTTLNNRPAEIKSGAKIPVTTLQLAGGGGGTAIATTEYIDVPLRLSITPQITDVGTVILNVVAENSAISSRNSTASAPGIDTQSMKTEVTVPDGGTTVVGGVLSDNESELVNRTPGVSRIPIFGNLFKRKSVTRQTSEILFFITPRIYRPDYAGTTRPTSNTVIQPVPLGNPASNSGEQPLTPYQNPLVQVQPAATAPTKP